jgi:membrane protease YdiL (CAAX protease family)
MPDGTAQRQVVVLLAVCVEGGLIVLSLALGWFLEQPPLARFAWSGHDGLLGLAATVPMLVAFALAQRWPVGPLGRIKQFTDTMLCPLLAPCSVLDLLGMSVLAGLGEEMLFRGVLQPSFARWMHPILALALASGLFGLLHAVTAGYAVLAALMGAYLGWLYDRTGNLLVPALAHALYDFLVLLYLLRGPGAAQRTQPILEETEEVEEEVGPP